jgi:hypothetical protein
VLGVEVIAEDAPPLFFLDLLPLTITSLPDDDDEPGADLGRFEDDDATEPGVLWRSKCSGGFPLLVLLLGPNPSEKNMAKTDSSKVSEDVLMLLALFMLLLMLLPPVVPAPPEDEGLVDDDCAGDMLLSFIVDMSLLNI